MRKATKVNRLETREIKVLLVDDHPFIREGLLSSLSGLEDLTVCGEASSAKEALQKVAKLEPDVVVSDISLEGKSGLDLIREMKERHPKTPVVVLSMHDEKIYGARALEAGARGYIMKREKVSRLAEAIRKVHAGRLHISEALSEFLLSGLSPDKAQCASRTGINRLSPREFEVFRLIGQGKNPREISRNLCVSIKTINTHRSNIRDKLGLDSFNDLLIYAVRWLESEG